MFVFVPHPTAAPVPSPAPQLPTAAMHVPPPGTVPPMAYAAPPHQAPPTIQVHGQTYVYVAPQGHASGPVHPYHPPAAPLPLAPVPPQAQHAPQPPAGMYYVPPPPAPRAHVPPPLPQPHHPVGMQAAMPPPARGSTARSVPQPPAPVDASVAAHGSWDGWTSGPEGGGQQRSGSGLSGAAPVAVGRGPIAAPHSSQHYDLIARGQLMPVSESLKDVLGRPIEEVDPKAVLRRSRTLRKKIRVAWYHLTRPPQDVSPAERVKASRLPEFEAALAQLDETARRLGVLLPTDEAVLQEGARLMLLAKEDLEAFCRTASQAPAGPPSHRGSDAGAEASVEGFGGGHRSSALLEGEEDEDGGEIEDADPQAAVYRKFVQSAAYHLVKMRRLHALIAVGRSGGGL